MSLQHLHAMIVYVTHKHLPVAINRYSTRAVEFPKAAAPSPAYGPNLNTACAAIHLDAMTVLVGHCNVAGTVQHNTCSALQLARVILE